MSKCEGVWLKINNLLLQSFQIILIIVHILLGENESLIECTNLMDFLGGIIVSVFSHKKLN